LQHAVAAFDGISRRPEARMPAQAKTAFDDVISGISQVAFRRFVSSHGNSAYGSKRDQNGEFAHRAFHCIS